MEREPKRQRLTSSSDPAPALVLSSSSPINDQQNESEAAAGGTAPTEVEIERMLEDLKQCKTIGEAEQAMEAFHSSLLDPKKVAENTVKENANKIAHLHGVAVILMSLKDWNESKDFSGYAIRSLVNMSCFAPKTREFIATVGVATILDTTTKKHSEGHGGRYVRKNTVALLGNLALSANAKVAKGAMTDDCIDLVIETMKTWPDDDYIQKCGCDYFTNVGEIEGMKTKLKEKRVGSLLMSVLEKFDKNSEPYDRAKRAMEAYYGFASQGFW